MPRDTQVPGPGIAGDEPRNIGAMRLRSGRQPAHLAQLVDTCGDGVGERHGVEESEVTRFDAHQGPAAAATEARALRLKPGSRPPHPGRGPLLPPLRGNTAPPPALTRRP